MPEALSPTEGTSRRAIVIAQARRKATLAIGVGGTVGGVVLLVSNVAYLMLADLAVLPWLPLTANVALIFGGAMFLREFRRRVAEQAPRTTASRRLVPLAVASEAAAQPHVRPTTEHPCRRS